MYTTSLSPRLPGQRHGDRHREGLHVLRILRLAHTSFILQEKGTKLTKLQAKGGGSCGPLVAAPGWHRK